jgi:1,4-alpha-glucan branching enzyme
LLNSDSQHYGGQNFGNVGGVETEDVPMHGFKHSLSMTLPPLGAVFLHPE